MIDIIVFIDTVIHSPPRGISQMVRQYFSPSAQVQVGHKYIAGGSLLPPVMNLTLLIPIIGFIILMRMVVLIDGLFLLVDNVEIEEEKLHRFTLMKVPHYAFKFQEGQSN